MARAVLSPDIPGDDDGGAQLLDQSSSVGNSVCALGFH